MVHLKQKKGDLTDTAIFVISVFVFGIMMLVLLYVVPSISNGLRGVGLNNTVAMDNAIDSLDNFVSIINYGTFFVMVGLLMSILITSFLVRSHPVFLILYVLFAPLSIILAVYLGNAYNTLATNAAFTAIYSSASMINLFFENLVKITLVANFLSIIIVFSKFNTFGGQQQF